MKFNKTKLLALFMACIVALSVPANALAVGNITPAENPLSSGAPLSASINAFAPLEEGVALQSVAVGTQRSALMLPATLEASVENGGESIFVPVVEWVCTPEYDTAAVGTYVFTPCFDDTLFTFTQNAAAPTITLSVQDAPAASPASAPVPTTGAAPAPTIEPGAAPPPTSAPSISIKTFEALPDDVARQGALIGTGLTTLTLPNKLQATDDQNAAIEIADVLWECANFEANMAGDYLFTAKLPQAYTFAPSSNLPKIQVTITAPQARGMMPMALPLGAPGESAANPANTAQKLADAITAANANADADIIYVAGNFTLDAPLNITATLTIIGTGPDTTTLTSPTAGGRHFIIGGGAGDFFVTIEGMTMKGPSVPVDGIANGGIFAGDILYSPFYSGTLTVNNCVITGCNNKLPIITNEMSHGGAVCNLGGQLVVMNDCIVSQSYSRQLGGGIFNTGAMQLTNCKIIDNTAGGSGGGIYVMTNTTLTNCIISKNSSAAAGGGAFFQMVARLNSCEISENNARSYGGMAGASAGVINDCAFLNNTSTDSVGGAAFALIFAANCTVAGNSTGGEGGGLSVGEGVMSLLNCTVTGNVAGTYGGGCDASSGTVDALMGTVISGNYLANGDSSEISLVKVDMNGDGSIIASTDAGPLAGSQQYILGIPNTGSLADLQTLMQAQMVDVDPGATVTLRPVGLVAQNGGNQKSILPAAALKAIPYDVFSTWPKKYYQWLVRPTHDVRGVARPTSGLVTIGAVEYDGVLPAGALVVSNTNDSGAGSLRSAIGFANSIESGARHITFDATAFAGEKTIYLLNELPTLEKEMTITGPGANLLTIKSPTAGGRHISLGSNSDDATATFDVTIEDITLDGPGFDANGNALGGVVGMENGGIRGGDKYALGAVDIKPYFRGKLTLNRCALTDNLNRMSIGDAAPGGAINLISPSASLVMNACTVSNNKSNFDGGAINVKGAATLINCTVSGNISTASGGGIAAQALNLTGCTIWGNRAPTPPSQGGGVYSLSAQTTMRGCIIANNTANDVANNVQYIGGSALADAAPALSNGYTLIGTPSGYEATAVFGTATPVLAYNGGTTQTFKLAAASPLVDGVPQAEYTAWFAPQSPPATDQRGTGYARISGNGADIGAVELQQAITALAINTPPAVIRVGGVAGTLTATPTLANAEAYRPAWQSNNTSALEVNASTGALTAKAKGTAIITVTAGGISATCTIEVVDASALATAIAAAQGLTQNNYTPASWQAMQTALAAAQSSYSNNSSTQAQLDAALAALNLAIQKLAIAFDGLSNTTITVGTVFTLTPRVEGTTGAAAWSYDSSFFDATFSGQATFTAKKLGKTTITFTAVSGRQGSVEVTIAEVPPATVRVTGVTLNKTQATINANATLQLAATVAPADAHNKNVKWKSSDASVATVDSNGRVNAIKAGNAKITATTEDNGYTAVCSITVTTSSNSTSTSTSENEETAATGAKLNKATANITAGDELTLTVTVLPAEAADKKVIWSSSDTSIATVDQNGKVVGIKAGNITITATTEDGKFVATCNVTVTAAAQNSEVVEPAPGNGDAFPIWWVIAGLLSAVAVWWFIVWKRRKKAKEARG